MNRVLGDLRYGWRILGKSRIFTAVAVLTLALGIGANTAIFSLVDTVLLRPLPYRQPDRLVLISEDLPQNGLGRSRCIGCRIPRLSQSESVVPDGLRLIVGQGMRSAAIGLLLGLTASLAIPGLMSSLLFGVGARDPWVCGLVAVLIGGVALVANAVPAHRATKVEPSAALRYE